MSQQDHEKVVAYLKENPDATTREACRATKVKLSSYYYQFKLLKKKKEGRQKKTEAARPKVVSVTVKDEPEEQPDKVVIMIMDPRAAAAFAKSFNGKG